MPPPRKSGVSPARRVAQHKALDGKKSASQTIAGINQDRRNEVCVAPKYPGKAEQYRYVLAEYCVRKDGSKVLTKAKKLPGTSKEIKAIEKILSDYPKNHVEPDVRGDVLRDVAHIFNEMISHANRTTFPDPVKRYHTIVGQLRTSGGATEHLPYYTIMNMILSHLKNI